MKAIVNGNILLPDRVVEGYALLYTNRIEDILPIDDVAADIPRIDAGGGYVAAGLIDLHVHGWGGVDTTTATAEQLTDMGRQLLKNGVTGFLATTMTVDKKRLETAWEHCRQAMTAPRSTLLGVNAEGPFISPAKCGAQNPTFAIPPDAEWMAAYADVIRLTTIAPEWPGAADATEELSAAGITVAVGHTAADYDTVMRCVDAGANHATHLFNAMSGLNHRAPGAVGATLNSTVTCELIADGHHVHPALYQPIWRIKGQRLCLVTDGLAAGGLPAGAYELGGDTILSDGSLCRRPDGTIAGSVLPLCRGVWNLYESTDIPLWECVNAASLNPATVLGIHHHKGSLEIGKDADIIITDTAFAVTTAIVGGETEYCHG